METTANTPPIPQESRWQNVAHFFSRSSAKIASSIDKVQAVFQEIARFFSGNLILFNPAQIGKFKIISGLGIISSLYFIPLHVYQNIKSQFYDTTTGYLHLGEDFYGLTVNTASFMEGCVVFGVKATQPLLEAISIFYALSSIFSIASTALNLKSFAQLPRKNSINALQKLQPNRIKVTLDISAQAACQIEKILKSRCPLHKAEKRIEDFVFRKALNHAILAAAGITHIIGVFFLLATPVGNGVIIAAAIIYFTTSVAFLIERHCFERNILSFNEHQEEVELTNIRAYSHSA
jgi:hypothetical protein